MDKKVTPPKKGAARKWADRLKKLREQSPSDELMNILNRTKPSKKTARSSQQHDDLDV
jgi:hypothetical protein